MITEKYQGKPGPYKELAGNEADFDNLPLDVANGSTFDEIDTGKSYMFDAENKVWCPFSRGGGGGGGDVNVGPVTITSNGEYQAPDGYAYNPITANVSNTYVAADEGKVVNNGALEEQTTSVATANGVVDTTLIKELTVNVQSGGGPVPTNWAQIQEMVRDGTIGQSFSIGDQVTTPILEGATATISGGGVTAATVDARAFAIAAGWRNQMKEFAYDGADWKTDNAPVNLADYGITPTGTPTSSTVITVTLNMREIGLDVTAIDLDVPVDSSKTHALRMTFHELYFSKVFEPAQAWIYCENGLPAGTYHVTYSGSSKEFTLASDIPAGGQIGCTSFTSNLPNQLKVYADKNATSATNVATAAGNSGTAFPEYSLTAVTPYSLEINGQTYTGAINIVPKAQSGSNRWKTSYMRAWLNSSDSDIRVGADARFSRTIGATVTPGLLYRLDPALVNVLGKTYQRTALLAFDGGGDGQYEDLEEKVFLLSQYDVDGTNINNVAEQAVNAAGVAQGQCTYYINANDQRRIKYNYDANASNWWLRSPYAASAINVQYVYSYGYVSNSIASYGNYAAPSLCII